MSVMNFSSWWYRRAHRVELERTDALLDDFQSDGAWRKSTQATDQSLVAELLQRAAAVDPQDEPPGLPAALGAFRANHDPRRSAAAPAASTPRQRAAQRRGLHVLAAAAGLSVTGVAAYAITGGTIPLVGHHQRSAAVVAQAGSSTSTTDVLHGSVAAAVAQQPLKQQRSYATVCRDLMAADPAPAHEPVVPTSPSTTTPVASHPSGPGFSTPATPEATMPSLNRTNVPGQRERTVHTRGNEDSRKQTKGAKSEVAMTEAEKAAQAEVRAAARNSGATTVAEFCAVVRKLMAPQPAAKPLNVSPSTTAGTSPGSTNLTTTPPPAPTESATTSTTNPAPAEQPTSTTTATEKPGNGNPPGSGGTGGRPVRVPAQANAP